ncbi:MAG: UDP-glucuronic acid decarboxylase family protein [Candidatus Hydrothermarchaeota archaeon]
MDVCREGVSSILEKLRKRNLSFEDKSVLVTGGAGFLGSWICDVLVSQNANVTCIDNFSSGRLDNVNHLIGENFKIIKHDISQPIFFNEKFDLVMHLASRASPLEFSRYPIQILKANTLGTWITLGIAKKYNSRFIYASTSEVYGDPDPRFIPTPESYYGNVNSLGSRGCYDEAKRCGESFVIAYHREHGLDVRIARIFNTYGPKMRAGDVYGRVVPRFIEQALSEKPITVFGDGNQTRSFLYVTDQILGFLYLSLLDGLEGEVINIGNNKETRIIELAEMIKKLTESKSEITFYPKQEDDPKRRCPDISKARRLLDWKPQVSLEEGLKKTIEWFKHESGYLGSGSRH